MSAARGLDPRVKLLLLLQAGFWAVLLERPLALGAAAALGVLALVATGALSGKWRRVFVSLGLLALMVWGLAVAQAVFYRAAPRTALVAWQPEGAFWEAVLGPGGLALYREGFLHGLAQGLRLVLAVSAGLAVAFSSDAGQLLAGLRFLRVPYGLSFMAVTALRFAPLMAGEAATAWRAARLRGFHPWRSGPAATLSVGLGLLRPVLASCVRRATTLAASVTSRGFDAARARDAGLGSANALSWFAGAFSVALTLALLTAKLLYLLYLQEVYYRSAWRGLYEAVREWL